MVHHWGTVHRRGKVHQREDAEPVRATSGTTCCCGPASRGEGLRADTTSACLRNGMEGGEEGGGRGKMGRSLGQARAYIGLRTCRQCAHAACLMRLGQRHGRAAGTCGQLAACMWQTDPPSGHSQVKCAQLVRHGLQRLGLSRRSRRAGRQRALRRPRPAAAAVGGGS